MAAKSEQEVAAQVFAATDPIALFEAWLAEAGKTEPNDANAMSLATVDEDGLPNVRVVLLKSVEEAGFVFYGNLRSAKGQELLASGKAALGFYWKSLHRQVRVRGAVEQVADAQADEYFATRPRGSQLGAWASNQSHAVESHDKLVDDVGALDQKYAGGDVPRPPHWSGFRLMPSLIEFWINREFRLHDRRVFSRPTPQDEWLTERLYP